jgi:hypothetical protein
MDSAPRDWFAAARRNAPGGDERSGGGAVRLGAACWLRRPRCSLSAQDTARPPRRPGPAHLPHLGDRAMPTKVAVSMLALSLALPGAAVASAQRTFVASNGNDANPCSLASPCRSFGAAIAQTNARGEVVVLDSAGYGRVTIGKSVTIVAPAGVYAGITVLAGTNGIDVLTPGLAVVLRGLSINGQGGVHGIYMNVASDLAVERCQIANMAGNGLFVEAAGAKVSVLDSSARGNGNGGFAFTGASSATLARVHAEGNQYAGVGAYDGAAVTVRDSTLVKNVKGIDALAMVGSNLITHVEADNVSIADNSAQGIYADALSNNVVRVAVSRSSIAHNGSDGALLQASSTEAWIDGSFSGSTFVDDNPNTAIHTKCPTHCSAWATLAGNRFTGNGTANYAEGVGAQIISGGGNIASEVYFPPTASVASW